MFDFVSCPPGFLRNHLSLYGERSVSESIAVHLQPRCCAERAICCAERAPLCAYFRPKVRPAINTSRVFQHQMPPSPHKLRFQSSPTPIFSTPRTITRSHALCGNEAVPLSGKSTTRSVAAERSHGDRGNEKAEP